MNRDDRINEILYYWRDIAKENPQLQFNSTMSSDRVYHDLIFRGVPIEDRRVDVSTEESKQHPNYFINSEYETPYAHPGSPFNNWIKYYARSDKTSVFVQSNWKYFCQFISKDGKARRAKEHLKVYIPLDSNHVEDGARLIFNFLEDNNISHESKIGRRIRFDNIVVRLIKPEDVDKLIRFVNNTPYLREGLLPANPFAYNRGGIALAVDGRLSYNSTVAAMIDIYIDHKKQTNTLNGVNVNDFYAYLEQLYRAYYLDNNRSSVEFNTLNGYIAREIAEREQNRGEKLTADEVDRIIENYRQVISLIIKSHNPSFTFSDYLKHYAENTNQVFMDERTVIQTNRMLIEALEAMTERFGNPDGYYNVRSFFYTGQETLITRNNNLRTRMVESPFRENLRIILNQNQMDFDTYAKNVLNQYHIDLAEIARMKGK